MAFGYIDGKNLKEFLHNHGYNAKNKDVNLIMRRLDRDGDTILNEAEFIGALVPENACSDCVESITGRNNLPKKKIKSKSKEKKAKIIDLKES